MWQVMSERWFDVVVMVLGAVGILWFGILRPIRQTSERVRSRPIRYFLRLVPPPLDPEPPSRLATLPQRDIWSIVAIAVTTFLVLAGPLWRTDRDFAAAIGWSYLPIPILVLALLLWRGLLGWAALFVDTLLICVVKFALTAMIIVCSWALWGAVDPGAADPLAMPVRSAEAHRHVRPPPSKIPLESTGVVEGTALDADGEPVLGAWLWIRAGLQTYVFAPPSEALTLRHDGAAISPSMAVLRTGQPLLVATDDEQLHTIRARDLFGRPGFHYPAVADGGVPRTVERSLGLLQLSCGAHADPVVEGTAHLLVVHHPFFWPQRRGGRFSVAWSAVRSPRGGGVAAASWCGLCDRHADRRRRVEPASEVRAASALKVQPNSIWTAPTRTRTTPRPIATKPPILLHLACLVPAVTNSSSLLVESR